MVAPPWIAVPPPGYGGIELVVALLCQELVSRGHDVTLFAALGSRSVARVRPVLDAAHPDAIGLALYEADHVARAWEQIESLAEEGRSFDVIHDHSDFTAVALADRVGVPVVHTVHGAFDAATSRFYAYHGHKATLVALSRAHARSAPPELELPVVPNPVRVDDWPLGTAKDEYLLWIGRMDPVKGADRAIDVARRAGRSLVLAGPVQPGQEQYFTSTVAPYVDGRHVVYVGEVTGARKQRLYAEAAALLMPIRWPEPFGMVMVEAQACGTPVLAFPEGTATEIVIDGENGRLVADEAEMARAVAHLDEIDPVRCRASVAERYDSRVVAACYERVYRDAIAPGQRPAASPARARAGYPTVGRAVDITR